MPRSSCVENCSNNEKSQPNPNLHGCLNQLNLEMEAEFLTKNMSYLNLNISRTKNGRDKL